MKDCTSTHYYHLLLQNTRCQLDPVQGVVQLHGEESNLLLWQNLLLSPIDFDWLLSESSFMFLNFVRFIYMVFCTEYMKTIHLGDNIEIKRKKPKLKFDILECLAEIGKLSKSEL